MHAIGGERLGVVVSEWILNNHPPSFHSAHICILSPWKCWVFESDFNDMTRFWPALKKLIKWTHYCNLVISVYFCHLFLHHLYGWPVCQAVCSHSFTSHSYSETKSAWLPPIPHFVPSKQVKEVCHVYQTYTKKTVKYIVWFLFFYFFFCKGAENKYLAPANKPEF